MHISVYKQLDELDSSNLTNCNIIIENIVFVFSNNLYCKKNRILYMSIETVLNYSTTLFMLAIHYTFKHSHWCIHARCHKSYLFHKKVIYSTRLHTDNSCTKSTTHFGDPIYTYIFVVMNTVPA